MTATGTEHFRITSMKTIARHFLPAAMILLSAACIKETEAPVTPEMTDMVFYGHSEIPEASKTALGDGYSVLWQENDAISVFSGTGNGRFEAAGIIGDGKTALFEGSAYAAGTYYALYPYNGTATIDGTAIHTELPAVQKAVPGSFDPAAALSAAKTSDDSFYFMNAGAIVGFSVKGTDVESVTLSSADGMTPMAGQASVSMEGDTPVMTVEGAHGISMSGPFEEGEKYYFVTAPGEYNGLALRFTDTKGRFCVRSMTKKMDIGRCGNKWLGEIIIPDTAWKEEENIGAEWTASTSSTLTFSWGEGTDTDSNGSHPYVFGLYRDKALTDPAAIYNSEKSSPVWGSRRPAFTFAGLEQDTEYWFAVTDPVTMCKSVATEAKTSAFAVVYPSEAPCAEGAVILAENFSELVYGGDGVNVAAGADQNGELCDQSKESLLWANGAMAGKRLEKWSALCQEGDTRNVVLARPGYMKLGGYSYCADLVSPALECIPQGKEAKVRVTFTASRYGSDSRDAVVSLVKGTEANNRFTAGSRNDIRFELNDKTGWAEYSFEFDGADSESRILIGTDFEKSGKGNGKSQHRMYLGDVKAEVLLISKTGGINAEPAGATSSTLKFRWTKIGSEASYNEAYSFGLYRDPELTDPVNEYTVTDNSVWNKRDPAFIFSGLEKGRTYYFHVSDNDNPDCDSDVISATTEKFELVEPSGVQTAAPGTVILAEDFSEYLYGGDGVDPYKAAGISGPGGAICNSGKDTGFGTQALLKGWSVCGGNAYSRPGYMKLGTAGASAAIVTPELSCIPQGKEAKIKVSFDAARFGTDSRDAVVSLAGGTDDNGKFTADIRTDIQFMLDESEEWNTYSFEIDRARSDSRILIGPDLGTGTESGRRMFIDNVRIEITGLSDTGINADFIAATSSTLKFRWHKTNSADYSKEAYTFGLYSDPECKDEVKVYSSTASQNNIWPDKTNPAFIFGGLEQGKTYYFRVSDANDAGCKSSVIAAAAGTFARVPVPGDVQDVTAGTIILAEDFSEFLYGGDGVGPCTAAGINKSGFVNSGNDTGIDMNGCLKNWSLLCQRTDKNDNYTRPGYIKLGGGSYVSDLVTPELSCIPEGKEATIRVTFSAATYSKNEKKESVVSLVKVSSDSRQFTTDEIESTIRSYKFNLPSAVEWNTYNYEFDGATKDSRIIVGPDADTANSGNGKSQHRMFLDNVIIEVISINDILPE